MGIPRELEEAARIDGAGFFAIYWRIVLPLSVPALTALGIFTFVATWNDFMGPLVYLNSQEKFTLTLGLAGFQGMYETDWPLLMAASVLTLLPIILLFLSIQRRFIEGVTIQGSIKG